MKEVCFIFVIARNEAIFPAKSNSLGRLLRRRTPRNDKENKKLPNTKTQRLNDFFLMRQKLANMLFLLVIFLLPWQTAFVYRTFALPEGATEYGRLAIYATEFLLGFAFLLRGKPILSRDMLKIVQGLFLFVSIAFFSMAFSSFAVISAGLILHLLCAGLLFLFLCDERTKLVRVMETFLLGLIAPCVLGWIQYATGSSPASTLLGLAAKNVSVAGIAVVATNAFRSLRAYGSFPHPNIFGGYLAVGIICVTWLARSAKTKTRSIALMGFLILFLSTLILTFSRSAWLALMVALLAIVHLIFYFQTEPNTKHKISWDIIPRNARSFLICGIVTVVLMISVLYAHVFARFNPTLHVESISIEERINQYKTFPDVFTIDPVLGVGPGSYIFDLESIAKGQPSFNYQPVHNTFLLILAELGVVGFGAFIFFLKQIGTWLWLLRKFTNGAIAIGLTSILCVIGLFDHYLFSMWCGLALSAFVLAAAIRISVNEFEK